MLIRRDNVADPEELDPAGAARHARDKIAAVRIWLLKHKPFFGVLARAFRIEPTLDVPAFRLYPGDRLLIHPLATLDVRFAALCARLAHLSLHAALAAFGRRKEREPRRWNVACDLAIAPMLEAADLCAGRAPSHTLATLGLPPGASAEAYYLLLPCGTAPDPLWCDLCDQDGQSTVEHAPNPALPALCAGAGGSELEWKIRLAAAYEEELAQGSPTFGEPPAWLDDMLRATIEPPANWSALLQRSIHMLQRSGRSYLRPSRRMSALCAAGGAWPDIVTMPGRRIEHAGRLCVIVDTSASLPPQTLSRFFGAIVAAATAESIDELRVLQADAAVTRDEIVSCAELLFAPIEIAGRGGTDFAPALLALAEESRRQGERFTAVYLTDLDGSFPTAASLGALDVIWVVAGKPRVRPPFGRIIEMAGD